MATLTWETAADWDANQSEDGVVHESVANTDHSDATLVKMGHSVANPYLPTNLGIYYPSHEDSGTTLNDFGSQANDASVTGATANQTALLGTTGYRYDGSDDYAASGSNVGITGSSAFSLSVWFKLDASMGDIGNLISIGTSGTADAMLALQVDQNSTSDLFLNVWDADNNINISTPLDFTTSFAHAVYTYDGSEENVYANATVEHTRTRANNISDNPVHVGGRPGGYNGQYFDGIILDARVYSTELTAAQVQTLYDVVDQPGTLTSSVKTAA